MVLIHLKRYAVFDHERKVRQPIMTLMEDPGAVERLKDGLTDRFTIEEIEGCPHDFLGVDVVSSPSTREPEYVIEQCCHCRKYRQQEWSPGVVADSNADFPNAD